MRCLLVLLLAFVAFASAKKDYTRYKVLRIEKLGSDDVQQLRNLESFGVEFWSEPAKSRPTDILVPGNVYSNVTAVLDKLGLSYTVIIENVQVIIDEEEKVNNFAKNLHTFFRTGGSHEAIHTYYAPHDDINGWLDGLSSEFSFVSTYIIGKSHERRNMKVLKVSSSSARKPVIWIDGGIHAREWIAPAVTNYLAWKLISGYTGGNQKIRSLVDQYEWHFLPVVNPDGYAHTHTDNRLWRKNRRPHHQYPWCYGADLNRNFGFHWAEVGTSTDPCSETFHGTGPFSEPESVNVKNALLKYKGRLQVYLSLHSFSQLWFVPYAYTTRVDPENFSEMQRVADAAVRATYRRYGRWYQLGKPGNILYPAAGGSYDWAKAVADAEYSYTIELRPTQREMQNGFILPPSSIKPTGEEIWDGVVEMASRMRRMN